MAEQTESSIEISASAEDVMAVIADFDSYPDWVDSIKTAEVLTWVDDMPETVRMVLDSGPIKDEYIIALTWPDELTARWRLVEGKLLNALDGAYDLEPLGPDTTTVTYTLSVEISLPLVGVLKRTAEKSIIDSALRGLKKRVEG